MSNKEIDSCIKEKNLTSQEVFFKYLSSIKDNIIKDDIDTPKYTHNKFENLVYYASLGYSHKQALNQSLIEDTSREYNKIYSFLLEYKKNNSIEELKELPRKLKTTISKFGYDLTDQKYIQRHITTTKERKRAYKYFRPEWLLSHMLDRPIYKIRFKHSKVYCIQVRKHDNKNEIAPIIDQLTNDLGKPFYIEYNKKTKIYRLYWEFKDFIQKEEWQTFRQEYYKRYNKIYIFIQEKEIYPLPFENGFKIYGIYNNENKNRITTVGFNSALSLWINKCPLPKPKVIKNLKVFKVVIKKNGEIKKYNKPLNYQHNPTKNFYFTDTKIKKYQTVIDYYFRKHNLGKIDSKYHERFIIDCIRVLNHLCEIEQYRFKNNYKYVDNDLKALELGIPFGQDQYKRFGKEYGIKNIRKIIFFLKKSQLISSIELQINGISYSFIKNTFVKHYIINDINLIYDYLFKENINVNRKLKINVIINTLNNNNLFFSIKYLLNNVDNFFDKGKSGAKNREEIEEKTVGSG